MSKQGQQPPFDADSHEKVDVTRLHRGVLREAEEPEDGHEIVPIGWLLLSFMLAIGSGFYLSQFSGAFSGRHYEGASTQLAGEAVAAAAPAAAVDPLVLGKRVFNNCAACHQQNGQGLTGAFPPLAQSEWVLGGKAALIRILLVGMTGAVEVRGSVYNGAMPAWGRLLDEDIAAVLTYIRNSWGNTAAAIDAQMVADVRNELNGHSDPYTAEQLLPLR